jgi:hypothetical protein
MTSSATFWKSVVASLINKYSNPQVTLVVVATSLSLPVRHALPSPTTEFCGSFEE